MTELYRAYDANGVLLYVGISWSAAARYYNGHRLRAEWSDKVASITIERFTTRNEALAAEAAAIEAENPAHNTRGKPIVTVKAGDGFRRIPEPTPAEAPAPPAPRPQQIWGGEIRTMVYDPAGAAKDDPRTFDNIAYLIRASRSGDTVIQAAPLPDDAYAELVREGVNVL